MRLLDEHRRADRLRASSQDAALIFAATPLQICVQLIQIAGFRQRHPVVATEVAAFAFDAALLVAAGRVAELALKPPVRSEGDEAARLLTAMSAQDLLHRTLQVVIAKHTKDAAEVGKRQLMRLEKCLLCGMSIGPMIGRAAGHRAHLEDLQLHAFTTQNRPRLRTNPPVLPSPTRTSAARILRGVPAPVAAADART